MDDTVRIACCFNKHMELPFLVLANSIKRHVKGDRNAVLYAFHSDPLVHDGAFFRSLDSGNFHVRFQPVQNQYEDVAVRNFNTAATLMRLMLPILLEGVDRLLYLDTDVIALRDVAPLYDTDLNGCALAAALDYTLMGIYPKNGWRIGAEPNTLLMEDYLKEVVRLSNWKAYFNAGVMVMDLNQFRKNGLIDAAGSFLERTNGRRLFNDQDALNHVVDGAFVTLDPRWNVQASRVEKDFDGADAGLAGVGALWMSDPWVIHYCGGGKPWSADTPGTIWDGRFWREAVECEALPLLLEGYFKQCEQRGITGLQTPGILLAPGTPALDKLQLADHARKFGNIPEVSAASMRIAANLGRPVEASGSRTAFVPVNSFSHNGGVPEDRTLVFNLADAKGHIVYGPYLWYPPGNYEAVFEISLTAGAGNEQARLVVEVTDDSFNFLAQRFLSVAGDLSEPCRTLNFAATGRELFLEFRIFADGFSDGTLRFSGVRLTTVEQALPAAAHCRDS